MHTANQTKTTTGSESSNAMSWGKGWQDRLVVRVSLLSFAAWLVIEIFQ